jgi:hypothetical protein
MSNKKVNDNVEAVMALLSLAGMFAGLVIVATYSSWQAAIGLLLVVLSDRLTEAFRVKRVEEILEPENKEEKK